MTFNLVSMAISHVKKKEQPLRTLASQNKILKNFRGIARKFRVQRGLIKINYQFYQMYTLQFPCVHLHVSLGAVPFQSRAIYLTTSNVGNVQYQGFMRFQNHFTNFRIQSPFYLLKSTWQTLCYTKYISVLFFNIIAILYILFYNSTSTQLYSLFSHFNTYSRRISWQPGQFGSKKVSSNFLHWIKNQNLNIRLASKTS